MSNEEKQNLALMLSMIEGGSNEFKNFMKSKNYDADQRNFDADIQNYMRDGVLNFNGVGAPNWTKDKQASANLTTYKVRIFYTPVAAVPAPVQVTFFASAFNPGVFAANGDLVFTNAGGDTATIQGLTGTGSFRSIMTILANEPFGIAFLRMLPQTSAQLFNPLIPFENTQWGGGSFNEITPDDYVNPDQQQLLRVDVPLNFVANQKRGLRWTINTTETIAGGGIGATFFVGETLNPTDALHNKPIVRNLGTTQPFFTDVPAGQIRNLIMQKMEAKPVMRLPK